jgi:hypothetical protein
MDRPEKLTSQSTEHPTQEKHSLPGPAPRRPAPTHCSNHQAAPSRKTISKPNKLTYTIHFRVLAATKHTPSPTTARHVNTSHRG